MFESVILLYYVYRQRRLYDQERQLRTLQLEAIRQLWREVLTFIFTYGTVIDYNVRIF
jgi:hypothetical protein